MARTYRRDGRGRFAGGGGGGGSASTRRGLRARAGTSATSPVLRRNPVSGTAKPRGTISGSRLGRSKDQFSRETQQMMGRKIGPKVARRAPTLRQQARAAGLRTVNRRTSTTKALRDNAFITSAPRGTIPKRDPGAAITSRAGRRTLSGANDSSRRGRRSKATAARAAQADGAMGRGEYRRLRRRPGVRIRRR